MILLVNIGNKNVLKKLKTLEVIDPALRHQECRASV